MARKNVGNRQLFSAREPHSSVLLCLTFGIVVSRPTPDEAAREADHAIVESGEQTVDSSTPIPSNLLVVTAPLQYEPTFS